MEFTHSYKDIVHLLDLKTAGDSKTVLFVGYGLYAKTIIALKAYKLSVRVLDPKKLEVTNTSSGDVLILSDKVLIEPVVKKELWRVAKEGAQVIVFDTVGASGKVKSLIPKDFNHQAHGLKSFHAGPLSFASYSVGIVRKDIAEHFRR